MPKLDEDLLTTEQAKLVEDLLSGKTIREIAEEYGVHSNTILNRKKHPAVKKALAELRRAAMVTAQNKLVNKAAWAAQKIIDMVDDPDATRVQFQAACKVYDAGVGVTVEDLENRVIALEEATTREV